jgi:hypothetical protein
MLPLIVTYLTKVYPEDISKDQAIGYCLDWIQKPPILVVTPRPKGASSHDVNCDPFSLAPVS